MDKIYSVYIIYSISQDIYYKGCTSNLTLRLFEHNHNKSRYTANKGPWKLVFVQTFESKTLALKREISIKKFSHAQLTDLLASDRNEVG